MGHRLTVSKWRVNVLDNTILSAQMAKCRRLSACAVVATLFAVPTSWAQFTPNESLVTQQPDLVDPEFNQARGQVVWADRRGKLWLANVNRTTGLFEPRNGKGLLVDGDAFTSADVPTLLTNGAEWVSTAAGDHIVYTKFPQGMPHTLENARLALATEGKTGAWSNWILSPESPRNTPYASHDPGDPTPRIGYIDAVGNHYWRNLLDASSETLVSEFLPSQGPLRFVQGSRAAVFRAPVNGVPQVMLHTLDTGTTQQITDIAGVAIGGAGPWMWQAPEFNNANVFFVVVNDVELQVYRQPPASADGQGPWELIRTIRTPLGGIIGSPEPFTHNGKSYVYFQATTPPNVIPSVLFMANIDPSRPMLRQLTPDTPRRGRIDAEVFVTDDGPYVYFHRLQVGDCSPCSDGIYRAYTGLPPAQ